MKDDASKPKRLIKQKGGQQCTGIHLYSEFDQESFEARWGTKPYRFRDDTNDYFKQIGMNVVCNDDFRKHPTWSLCFATHYRGVSVGVRLVYRPHAHHPHHDARQYATVSISLASEDVQNLEQVLRIITRRFQYLTEYDYRTA